MKVMNHPNICGLKAYFYTQGETKVCPHREREMRRYKNSILTRP